jgi:hypothetical protein
MRRSTQEISIYVQLWQMGSSLVSGANVMYSTWKRYLEAKRKASYLLQSALPSHHEPIYTNLGLHEHFQSG